MNSHGEFIYRKLIQNRKDPLGPDPQPFSQREKVDSVRKVILISAVYPSSAQD